MRVLDKPVQLMTRLGQALTPTGEAERRARARWAVVLLVVLGVIYYRLLIQAAHDQDQIG